MNFSGRSVREASRVMEIEEVFEVRMVSGLRCGINSSKMAVLTASRSGGGLNDQIGLAKVG